MATIGVLNSYKEGDDICNYFERLDQYFIANEIDDDRRVAVLITAIGDKPYELLKSLAAPTLPKAKTYTELVLILTNHYQPKPLIIAERFRFHRRNQNSESVGKYVAELRRLASTCSFGAFLDDALRDRLVCGLQATSIQKKLLSETNINNEASHRDRYRNGSCR